MSTIVHVGLHKTGTTALQDFLSSHRKMLATHGVHYPADPRGEWAGTHRLACWLSSPRALDGPNDLFTPEREAFSKITGARKFSPEDFLGTLSTQLPVSLLSSEIFDTFNREELTRLKSFIGPVDRFLLYVRDGIGYIYSCWSSKVRWGYTGTFGEFLRATVNFEPATPVAGPLLFAQLLADCFGEGKLVVRNLATASDHPRGLIGYFLEQELKVIPGEDIDTDPRSNVSPAYVVTEVMRMQNLRAGSSYSQCHQALTAALAGPEGAEILHDFNRRIAPVTKPVSIGELAPTRISADGSISGLAELLESLFSDWRFDLGEQRPSCETQELLAALDDSEIFKQLSVPPRSKSASVSKQKTVQHPKSAGSATGARGSLSTVASRLKALFTTAPRDR